MKKKLLYFMAVLIFLTQVNSCVLAKISSVSPPVEIAIKKYKAGNYTGCLQDSLAILKKDPSNPIVYYYMAMSYTQAGLKSLAIQSYSKVLTLKPNKQLMKYATMGKRCLETPDKCDLQPAPAQTTAVKPTPKVMSDMDKFIAEPSSTVLSDSIKADFYKKKLKHIQNEINSNKDIDNSELKEFRDYSIKNKKSSKLNLKNKKIANNKPSNEEIAVALKVLKDAGLNPSLQYAQAPNTSQTRLSQTFNPNQNRSAELSQLNMLLGNNGNNQSGNNNSIMNMLPYMLAQNKNGKSNYSPELMQSIIMNSMMDNLDFNLDDKKK